MTYYCIIFYYLDWHSFSNSWFWPVRSKRFQHVCRLTFNPITTLLLYWNLFIPTLIREVSIEHATGPASKQRNSSGHLVLSHFGTCICSDVDTSLSWTFRTLNFEQIAKTSNVLLHFVHRFTHKTYIQISLNLFLSQQHQHHQYLSVLLSLLHCSDYHFRN